MSDITNKPEKLVSAIYLITSFFSDLEPLKWKLRSMASEIIPLVVSLNSDPLKEKQPTNVEMRNLILKIMGLLSVAKNVALISAENQELLQNELTKYADTANLPIGITGLLKFETSREKIKDMDENLEIKDRIEYKSDRKQFLVPVYPEKSLKEFGAVYVKKNTRQSIIMAILKRKKEIIIKDVSPLIGGCSEKTIQRELSDMVKTGVLRKIGEKRWSRYSLA